MSTCRGKRVLVVEDDTDIAQLVRLHLEDEGCAVEWVGRGEDAERALASGGFDLVVLDRMLPDSDGIDICKRLRGRSDHIPVLVLTARSAELDRVVGLELGADDYLTKPFSLPELLARVRAILRRAEAMQRAAAEPAHGPIHVGELSRVFEPFYRAPTARCADTEGSGLGLAIAQGILRLHHTVIRADSRPGEGAELRFELPASA